MEIEAFEVGQLKTNCYLLIDGDEAVIIDPGDEGDFLSEQVLQRNRALKYVIATHGHFDHVLGALELTLNFNAPFYAAKEDIFLIKQARNNTKHWLGYDPQLDPPVPTEFLTPKTPIVFGTTTLRVIPTPGHTPGSASLYNEKERALFCGDLLFKDGVGRTDFSYSSLPDLLKSLRIITSLPEKTVIYPGHGSAFSLASYMRLSPNKNYN